MAQQLNPILSRSLSQARTKRIAIIGSGIVGSATGLALLNSTQHEVILYDVQEQQLARAYSTLSRLTDKNFGMTINIESALTGADYAMICVPTPESDKNSKEPYDYSLLDLAVGRVASSCSEDCTIIIRSTIDPIKARKLAREYGNVWFVPEFLREKTYLDDAQNPDRIIVGIPDPQDSADSNAALELFRNFRCPKYIVSLEEAALTKLVTNSFLATKISFFNEIGKVANSIPNVDPEMTAELIALDSRIGRYGIKSGKPYGGKCLPKDSKALLKLAGDLKVLGAVDEVNQNFGGAA
jgi:UDPglucose 6-dehydrogenase